MNKRFAFIARPVNVARGALVSVGLAAGLPAFAALDVSAATTGVTEAATGATTVLAAMIVMAAAIFGLRKIIRLLGR